MIDASKIKNPDSIASPGLNIILLPPRLRMPHKGLLQNPFLVDLHRKRRFTFQPQSGPASVTKKPMELETTDGKTSLAGLKTDDSLHKILDRESGFNTSNGSPAFR